MMFLTLIAKPEKDIASLSFGTLLGERTVEEEFALLLKRLEVPVGGCPVVGWRRHLDEIDGEVHRL